MRITPDFSTETMKDKRAWTDIMQTLREQRCQSKLLYPTKLSITIDEETKIFQDKTKLIQYLTTKSTTTHYRWKTQCNKGNYILVKSRKLLSKKTKGRKTHRHNYTSKKRK